MTVRVTFHETAPAEALAETLATAGYEAALSRERSAGEDDGEEVVHVVQTDAPVEELSELVDGQDAWLEVSDPMTGTSAVVPPDAPRRRRT